MTEEEIIEKLRQENEGFKKLEEEHRDLDMQIVKIDKKKYLTPEEDMKKKQLKKEKLNKKDKIARMIGDYKKSAN